VSLIEGTVRENIARMDEAEPRSVIDAARNADVHEMIGAFPHGYETRVGDSGFTLSGGQKQRVALARALFGDPVLLVLDEPNANLDQVGEQALVQSLAAAKEAGATIVLVTHRPSIVGVCNKLMVLKDGAVAQYGPRAEVLRGVTVASAATKERREAATSNVARLVKS
jgi:ATP-binding cassette subfamily C protein